MLSSEKERLISNLINIELAFEKMYNRFSARKNFTVPVQNFWRTIALEEALHAEILDKIHQGIKEDKISIIIDIKLETLKKFIEKVNGLIKEASLEDLTETEAYSLGAALEVELDESGFTKMIKTTDQNINQMLKRVENDTKKHRVMLVNYSRGIK